MKKNDLNKWITFLFTGILALAAAVLLFAWIFTGDTIRKGIRIENTDVSWMSAEQAAKEVGKALETSFPADRITLKFGSKSRDLLLEEIGYRYSVEDTVRKAYSIGRDGGIFRKVFRSIGLLFDNQLLYLETEYDKSKLHAILSEMKKECDRDEKNAEIAYDKGIIRAIQETTGLGLDIDRNLELVENQLRARNFGMVELLVEERKPRIVYEDIKEIRTVLSGYSTRFNTGDVNRSDNIRLACSRINGIILLLGEEFSMNEALGPRTAENGYKEATVILKNELTPGTGGGVCQVSSTLYNSVLLAGLDVMERTHHSMPLSYISPGRDATINEDSIDFRFKNGSDYSVCVQADVEGNKVSIRILGKKRDDFNEIRLRTKTLAEYQPEKDEIVVDDTLSPGERVVERKAIKGLRVILYRETYSKGKFLAEEKLTEDYYRPIRGKVRLSRVLYNIYMASVDRNIPGDIMTGNDTVNAGSSGGASLESDSY